jgi:trimeric autotransporter adhesin
MAFPTIQTADTKNGVVTVNANSWTLTYPTNIAAGDLLLAFVGTDGTPGSISFTGGFTAYWQNAVSAAYLIVGAKIATGSETGTFTFDMDVSESGGWRVFRITGWFGSGLPTSGSITGTAKDADGLSMIGTSSATANPDPPNLDPANWATEDTLWFAACGVDTSRTISVYPLANNNTADVSGGSGGATLGLCTLNDAVSSKNPGTFTISASDDWGAATVAVRPAAAAGAPGPPPLKRRPGHRFMTMR